MSSGLYVSKQAARNLHLAAQGLLRPPARRARKEDVLAAIRRMGVLQIDTISVVARSPYLVLWSRLGQYCPQWLEELLAERHLFEYWAHEACFIPIEDFRWYRACMLEPEAMGWKNYTRWQSENRAVVEQVLQHVRRHGEVRSRDFERSDGKAGGWWEWKPEKRALESLFTGGKLMIARRENFHRVYDLQERILPDWDDAQVPDAAERDLALTEKAVKALGICKAAWIGDYFRTAKSRPKIAPELLVEQGYLLPLRVEGFAEPFFIHADDAQLAAQAEDLRPTHSSLLSPFDPVVWDRRRAGELFDFDYRIECYTPQDKRQYGYFCLPLLRRGRLIGRLDAKAVRKQGQFVVLALYLEPGIKASSALAKDLLSSLQACANWHACPQLILQSCADSNLEKILRAMLAAKEENEQT